MNDMRKLLIALLLLPLSCIGQDYQVGSSNDSILRAYPKAELYVFSGDSIYYYNSCTYEMEDGVCHSMRILLPEEGDYERAIATAKRHNLVEVEPNTFLTLDGNYLRIYSTFILITKNVTYKP